VNFERGMGRYGMRLGLRHTRVTVTVRASDRLARVRDEYGSMNKVG
jgi:hypothetical protein